MDEFLGYLCPILVIGTLVLWISVSTYRATRNARAAREAWKRVAERRGLGCKVYRFGESTTLQGLPQIPTLLLASLAQFYSATAAALKC